MRRFKDWVDKQAKIEFVYNAEKSEQQRPVETGRGVFNKRQELKEARRKPGRNNQNHLGPHGSEK